MVVLTALPVFCPLIIPVIMLAMPLAVESDGEAVGADAQACDDEDDCDDVDGVHFLAASLRRLLRRPLPWLLVPESRFLRRHAALLEHGAAVERPLACASRPHLPQGGTRGRGTAPLHGGPAGGTLVATPSSICVLVSSVRPLPLLPSIGLLPLRQCLRPVESCLHECLEVVLTLRQEVAHRLQPPGDLGDELRLGVAPLRCLPVGQRVRRARDEHPESVAVEFAVELLRELLRVLRPGWKQPLFVDAVPHLAPEGRSRRSAVQGVGPYVSS